MVISDGKITTAELLYDAVANRARAFTLNLSIHRGSNNTVANVGLACLCSSFPWEARLMLHVDRHLHHLTSAAMQ